MERRAHRSRLDLSEFNPNFGSKVHMYTFNNCSHIHALPCAMQRICLPHHTASTGGSSSCCYCCCERHAGASGRAVPRRCLPRGVPIDIKLATSPVHAQLAFSVNKTTLNGLSGKKDSSDKLVPLRSIRMTVDSTISKRF
jgi:hypothetical protein|eukprot:COSAG06_NODE_1003_length_11130_cov_5.230804_9_plen_140_part_00